MPPTSPPHPSSLSRLRPAALLLLLSAPLGCGNADSPPARPAAAPVQLPAWAALPSHPLVAYRPLLPLVPPGPPDAVAAQPPTPLFSRLDPSDTGLNFRHEWKDVPNHRGSDVQTSFAGGGVAVGDYDGDGLPDLYLTRPFGGGRLYRNLGGMRFADATADAALTDDLTWGAGCSFIDIDNDDDLDLYVCAYDSPNRLWINDGRGRFTEHAADFRLDFHGASVVMAFADYDSDGDLDGYLLTNQLRPADPPRPRLRPDADGKPALDPDQADLFGILPRPDGGYYLHDTAGQRDRLYRNNGDGSFTDVTDPAGIDGHDRGLAALWWDWDEDGRPDLYVANDFYGPDRLYRNNGDGAFTDRIAQLTGRTPWFSMGADIGDVNNDGRIDLLASDMAGSTHYLRMVAMGDMADRIPLMLNQQPQQVMRNTLYLTTGPGRAIEAATLLGVAETDWSWSVRFADLDLDGHLDLLITNGMTRDTYHTDLLARAQSSPGRLRDILPPKPDTNLALRNTGRLRFENAGPAWGLDEPLVTFAAAASDLDADGDLDIVMNHFHSPAGLYRNNSRSGRRVLISLVGRDPNRRALGATVRLRTDAPGTQTRYLTSAHGFASSSDPTLHFGLGEHDLIRQLTITWPSGRTTELSDLPADRWYRITEPDHPTPSPSPSPSTTPLVLSDLALPDTAHVETDFDDASLQPLLPESMSRFGPPLAVGDLNGDAIPDLVLGGAAGQPTRVLLHQGAARFHPAPSDPFDANAPGEDTALTLFDADSDGDPDLYVGRGSFEFPRDDDRQTDLLYLNDGSGRFTAAPDGSLPRIDILTAVAAAADVDADGDPDLFIGARAVAGRYPAAPTHRLLLNDGAGRFTDAPAHLNPWLTTAGMVTDAAFADLNADGQPDLILTHDYGPVRFLLNTGPGAFRDHTAPANLAHLTGRWRSLAAADLDADGDIDLVAGNQGLNEPRAASPDDRIRRALFLADFESLGRDRLLEAYAVDNGPWLPLRPRPDMLDVFPLLESVAPTYDAYARASLADLFGQSALASAHAVTAHTFESGLFINDGSARFTFHPLPRIAQAAPVNDILLIDLVGDPRLDLVLAQNQLHTHPTTPRQDSGLGLLLVNVTAAANIPRTGDPLFQPLWPADSGLILPHQHPALGAIDLNDDTLPDLIATTNHGSPVIHLQTPRRREP